MPDFMLHSAVANRNWDLLFEISPEYQLVLLDADDRILAAHSYLSLADGYFGFLGLTS